MVEFSILVVSLVLSILGFKKIKILQIQKGTSKVLTLLASLSASFIIFMIVMVIGFAIFVNTPKPQVNEEIKQVEVVKKKEAIKDIQLIDVYDYLKDSPEYVFANFINAWASQDFETMANNTQIRWKKKEEKPAVLLKNQYDFKHLLSAKITKVEGSGSSAFKITANIRYKTVFNNKKIEDVHITGMVIKEDGIWGVNPISTLMEN